MKRSFAFILRSMMWSALLYATFMLIFNWEDVCSSVKGRNAITVVNDRQVQKFSSQNAPANITVAAKVYRTVTAVIKTVAGKAAVVER